MESPVQEGDVLAGKYRVEKVLGFGGMGVVVSAFRGDLEQRVAVKFLSAAAAERPDAAERFRREARAAAKIRSEHVARVLDVGTLDSGLPYMVMEFLEGNDIAEEIRQHRWLPVGESVEFMLQAIEALAEAHAAGIVHRDLKPGNIYLARRADGTRRVKVLDFGISKALNGTSLEALSLTKTAALIGSPLYMAPEQMRSAKDVDTRADIWSLGAMLYEMLTGQLPFTGESVPQLCAALLHEEPVPLRQLRPDVPEGLEQAVLRCLAKDRANRFPTVYDLGRALLPYAQPESRIHVERAERMLGATDVALSGVSLLTERSSSSGTSSPFLVMTPNPTPLPPIEPTVNSWGKTDGLAAARSKRKGLLLVVGLSAAAAAAVVVGLIVARDGNTTAKLSPASSAREAPRADLGNAGPRTPEKVATQPAAPTELDSGSRVPGAAPVIASTPPAPRQLLTKAKPAGLAQPAKSAKKPEPAKAGQSVTDFGGRR